jgi:hypothetical protein
MEPNDRERAERIAEAHRYASLLSLVLTDCLLSCDFGRHVDALRWHTRCTEDTLDGLDRLQREVWQ